MVTVEGTSGRARSGGNSAINTNIFRSVLQPCFDNHPHQHDSAYPLRYAIPTRRPPQNPSRFLLGLPARIRSLCLASPSDLKYVDTLTHATKQAVPHAYTKRGDVSHPLRLTYQVPRGRSPFLSPLAIFSFHSYSRTILLLALTFFAS